MMIEVDQRPRRMREHPAGPDRNQPWIGYGYDEPTGTVLTMFGRVPGRNRYDDEANPTGIALVMQQTTQIATDLSAVRVDIAKMATQIEALPDIESRLREMERRPSTTDLEARVRLLERWRYALPITAITGIGSTVGALIAVFHH